MLESVKIARRQSEIRESLAGLVGVTQAEHHREGADQGGDLVGNCDRRQQGRAAGLAQNAGKAAQRFGNRCEAGLLRVGTVLAEAADAENDQLRIALEQLIRSEAERLALRSHQLGPKSGSLCARNWQTVVEARTALGDAPTVEAARERLKECRIKPLLRM